MPKTGDWKYSNERAYWLVVLGLSLCILWMLISPWHWFNAIMLILEHLIFCFSFQS